MLPIAVDAMGGDRGPSAVIAGLARSAEKNPDIRFLVFGDRAQIDPLLSRRKQLAERCEVRHAEGVVTMDAKPSHAMRNGKGTSMWESIDSVRNGEAQVCVSCGNTGALMAMSKICLRTMAQIDRPALAALWPTLRGRSIVLDVGATIGADAQHYVDLDMMGAAMARSVLGLERPTVGLLNVGVEEIKGVEAVKEAGRILRESALPHLDYHGFVEGDDLGKGTVDVVVTEGFTGNIALKTAEGTAKQMATYLREALTSSLPARAGALLAQGGLRKLKDRMDPRRLNGGPFLGLNGIVIKSHGGTDAEGFAAAVDVGYDMVRNGLKDKIENDLQKYHAGRPVEGAQGVNDGV